MSLPFCTYEVASAPITTRSILLTHIIKGETHLAAVLGLLIARSDRGWVCAEYAVGLK